MTKPAFHTFESREAALNAAYHLLGEALHGALFAKQNPLLLCSGGSTPGPLYERLSKENIDWSRVSISLVDERWVPESDKGSNTALVKRTLLQNNAASASYLPLKTAEDSASDAEASLDEVFAAALKNRPVFSVLGMGPDGHTASWFPGSQGLKRALGRSAWVAAIQATKSEVTGDYLERMTLSRRSLKTAELTLLIIFGETKREVYEQALADDSLPVHYAIKDLGQKMKVLWAA